MCVSLPGETCSTEVSTSTKSVSAKCARNALTMAARPIRNGRRSTWALAFQNGGRLGIIAIAFADARAGAKIAGEAAQDRYVALRNRATPRSETAKEPHS